MSLFFTSLATRTRRQLAILVRLPVEAALHFIVGRAVKLGRLMLQRLSPNFMVAPATPLGVAPSVAIINSTILVAQLSMEIGNAFGANVVEYTALKAACSSRQRERSTLRACP